MSTPEENYETATDESADRDAREAAIDTLETANECSRLAKLARMDGIDESYRELALDALAHPQCRTRLRQLVEGDDLSGSLRERAERLLDETPESAGAGPS
ncbi:hypothetical protein [Halostella litorea]|uniref:hypothetical protein n=1 Tax=Halostella litorea TaxID=2528831 RepID=UPI0010920014|nr:hypothetical protein [Halostella litorea]